MADESTVLIDRYSGVLVIAINRVDARNAIIQAVATGSRT